MRRQAVIQHTTKSTNQDTLPHNRRMVSRSFGLEEEGWRQADVKVRAPEQHPRKPRTPRKLYKKLWVRHTRTKETAQVQMYRGTFPSLNQTGEGCLYTFGFSWQVLVANASTSPSSLLVLALALVRYTVPRQRRMASRTLFQDLASKKRDGYKLM